MLVDQIQSPLPKLALSSNWYSSIYLMPHLIFNYFLGLNKKMIVSRGRITLFNGIYSFYDISLYLPNFYQKSYTDL